MRYVIVFSQPGYREIICDSESEAKKIIDKLEAKYGVGCVKVITENKND